MKNPKSLFKQIPRDKSVEDEYVFVRNTAQGQHLLVMDADMVGSDDTSIMYSFASYESKEKHKRVFGDVDNIQELIKLFLENE